MKVYYVYMVRCSDGSFYIGITNDVQRRVAQHNFGEDERSYTYSRRPVQLVYATDFTEVLQAIAFEKQLKGWSRAKKQALVDGNWARIVELSNQ